MQRLLSTAFLLAAYGLAGCVAPEPERAGRVVECKVPAASPSRAGAALVGQSYGIEMTPIPIDAVQFTDAGLWERVAVQHLSAKRSPTDTVQVTARLVNCTDTAQVVGMRTSFMDETQAPSEAASAWQVVHLRPRATALYSENSTSTKVRHYLIEVRVND
jgi:hypothetical protein